MCSSPSPPGTFSPRAAPLRQTRGTLQLACFNRWPGHDVAFMINIIIEIKSNQTASVAATSHCGFAGASGARFYANASTRLKATRRKRVVATWSVPDVPALGHGDPPPPDVHTDARVRVGQSRRFILDGLVHGKKGAHRATDVDAGRAPPVSRRVRGGGLPRVEEAHLR